MQKKVKILSAYAFEENTTASYLGTYIAWQVYGSLKFFHCGEGTCN